MSIAQQELRKLHLGPDSGGVRLTPEEFDAAEFEEGWRYELIHGVLVVSQVPSPKERDPNGQLEYLLRRYQEDHPRGGELDVTLFEQTVVTSAQRRRADRVIYAGLGRAPHPDDVPTIIVEFVSAGKRNVMRDYEEKRDEYLSMGVREYWVIDRFARRMTVYRPKGAGRTKQVIREGAVYRTPLLPGFELPLDRLLQRADYWE